MDKKTYLSEINNGLKGLPEVEAVVDEIESHIEHHLFHSFQEGKSEEEAMETLMQAFGTPAEIVSSFKKEQPVSFRAFLMFHLFFNSTLFAVGIVITMMHVWLESPIVHAVWKGISVSVWLILASYVIYWVLIGYQGMREFGKRGEQLVLHTILICMVPNIIFMLVFLFHLIPVVLFQSLLTPWFVGTCACATLLFPLFGRMGCYIGRR
ncbi:permease prefix domain 1-containing protein [Bacillus cabrialesii]|uniref:Permease prefix domain 1-containing protein n=1 Tax=Bacillus cabrialesii subsp. tritici TaxID=2944916 RepID=A0ABT9DR36_9BACI|nr:permease prefix domain 1-containing protein [Bacillus cabrialesii]MDO8227166.1 permease prefix domain 1-containing protein [Bacillus cabrialesii subsp. tritici]